MTPILSYLLYDLLPRRPACGVYTLQHQRPGLASSLHCPSGMVGVQCMTSYDTGHFCCVLLTLACALSCLRRHAFGGAGGRGGYGKGSVYTAGQKWGDGGTVAMTWHTMACMFSLAHPCHFMRMPHCHTSNSDYVDLSIWTLCGLSTTLSSLCRNCREHSSRLLQHPRWLCGLADVDVWGSITVSLACAMTAMTAGSTAVSTNMHGRLRLRTLKGPVRCVVPTTCSCPPRDPGWRSSATPRRLGLADRGRPVNNTGGQN